MKSFTDRNAISDIIGLQHTSCGTEYKIINSSKQEEYTRYLIKYNTYNDEIPAYLLIPDASGPRPAVLVHHQHNRKQFLGKSEVCGLAGNPLQAFGPALAQKGFVVLAPDSIFFEDRRKNAKGIEPLPGDADFWQHHNEMCYRIVHGENLMKTVIEDAMQGISLLAGIDFVDKNKIGTLGHSYGGNTVLFLAALDERIRFACASGSACTYKNRIENNVGIEMASVIPGFCLKYDIDDVAGCIAPRDLLLVSASEDKYSRDADYITQQISFLYANHHREHALCHKRYSGGHAITQERFDFIINWLIETSEHI
ncbi:MAG: prolyl oligopeptidase family serine peptidase [Oscillospiraceae bacterium]|jgi:dienelactone hydrolase|nr:prolyl oligopeptidase family serine peptidase [Oscillospiraceae bacterium]